MKKGLLRKKSLNLKQPGKIERPPPAVFKLFEFLSRKGHLLPLQVIVRSKDGKADNSSSKGGGGITVNQKINLLFLKNTKVAEITDPTTSETFSIPFNSSIKLGVIYDPDPDDELASPYMQLKLASDVMKLKQLPVILAATNAHNGGSPEKSVSESEVLFVKGVMKGGGASKGKQLHVVNTSDEEKCLAAKCSGLFSTDPRHTKLHLPALFSQEFDLPKYSIIYAGREMGRSLPGSMSNSPVLLEGMKGETSVIATCGEIFSIIAGENLESGTFHCIYKHI